MTLVTTQVGNLISDVGFPIAAFCLMYKMANTSIKDVKDAIEKLTLVITERLK